MLIPFVKYQGTGNDFVLIDDREAWFPASTELIAHCCHRRFGIGADGLILIRKAEGYDFRMVYYNADGHEGSMCGNGGRCAVQFARDLGIFTDHTHFIAVDGAHEASLTNGLVRLKMTDVLHIEQHEAYDFLNTGSPHYVAYVANVDTVEVVPIGREVRYGPVYGPQGGTNVNFVEVLASSRLKVRTYERGVEDETYSCGTGVTACAISAYLKEAHTAPIQIETLGGTLSVDFKAQADGTFREIFLTGPATRVFEGSFIAG
jgi:diaminopimelate epimerase